MLQNVLTSTALYTETGFNFSSFSVHKMHLCPDVRVGITEPCGNVSPEGTFSSQGATHLLEELPGQIPRPLLFFKDVIPEHLLCDSG